ncbi:chemotaxis protein CheY [Pseudomonas costantinii]|uniref:chemotaxis protein CheY n=1 Tax=Pseudomonas costantinii TaxID=168469 RepID=UPI0015A07A26|nr:chemotaxis protein CheY [Pseudomonas costantinii]NVZ69147.1 chemotaxis protein CheY [Pseudomonas costantinii]
MANKRLRIMILERNHLQRLSIEKMLNELGYYRIAVMRSSSEVFSVLRHTIEAFDLVIANRTLVADASSDFNTLCKEHPMVRHVVVYDCPAPAFTAEQSSTGVIIHTSLSHPPDSHSIRRLMRAVDSQVLLPVESASSAATSFNDSP